MALPSSGDIDLRAIITEVFGSYFDTDFLTCVDASLLLDKSRPITFKPKFQGYVDNITFTSSPTSRSWGYQETTSYDVTIQVDSPTVHIDSFPSWITLKDYQGTQLNAGNTLNNGGTPGYVLSITAASNGGAARSGNIVIHLAAPIGNAYQTQSGTTMNIAVYQDALPVSPSLGGFSIGDTQPLITSLTNTSCTGISLNSSTIYPVFTPNGSFSAGNKTLQVWVGAIDTGTLLYNSTVYMSNGNQVSATCGLSRALTSGEVVYIQIGYNAI